jgi:hypothetical protein
LTPFFRLSFAFHSSISTRIAKQRTVGNLALAFAFPAATLAPEQ